MSTPPDTRNEALSRLAESASALEGRTARPTGDVRGDAVSQAYRIIAELVGGVLVGLALGFAVDRVFGSAPWGLLGGVLLGFAASLVMARRTANRLMAQARAEQAARETGAAGPNVTTERAPTAREGQE